MRIDVALVPSEFLTVDLRGRTAVIVDVMRATTSVVAAMTAGCRQVIPVRDVGEALTRARDFPPAERVMAGEREGEPIPGFDLGNSPLEFTPERVGGSTVILTTTNGTAAMLAAATASAATVAAFTNVGAVARWVAEEGRDCTVLCAGEHGGFSLEDAVCAGLLVGRVAATGRPLVLSDGAMAARRLGGYYGGRLRRLLDDATWARALRRAGRADDLAACLAVDTVDQVPVLQGGVVRRGPGSPVPREAHREARAAGTEAG
jgi:2-phosphosulfolactate phosphatase